MPVMPVWPVCKRGEPGLLLGLRGWHVPVSGRAERVPPVQRRDVPVQSGRERDIVRAVRGRRVSEWQRRVGVQGLHDVRCWPGLVQRVQCLRGRDVHGVHARQVRGQHRAVPVHDVWR